MKRVYFALSLLGAACAVLPCWTIAAAAQEHPVQSFPSPSITSEIIAKNLVHRGNEKSARGDLDGAIADYKQAIQIKPNYARAYFNLGVVYCLLGEPEAEIAYFSEAIKYNPKDADSFTERGLSQIKVNDIKGAMTDFEQALKLNPKQARAYWGRGQARQRQGDTQGAVSDFTLSIQIDPTLAPAYLYRGNTYFELGALDKNGSDYMRMAVADYTQAIKLEPNLALAYHNRGYAYAQLGNKQGALADIKKAADIYKQQNLMDDYKEEIAGLESLKNSQ